MKSSTETRLSVGFASTVCLFVVWIFFFSFTHFSQKFDYIPNLVQ